MYTVFLFLFFFPATDGGLLFFFSPPCWSRDQRIQAYLSFYFRRCVDEILHMLHDSEVGFSIVTLTRVKC